MIKKLLLIFLILIIASPCFATRMIGMGGSEANISAIYLCQAQTESELTPYLRTGGAWYALISYINYEYALFVKCGQSNCVGQGDSAFSPSVTDCYELNNTTLTTPLQDPVGGTSGFNTAASGSAWPSFAQKYYQLTGQKVIIMSLGINGSCLTSGEYMSWHSSTYATAKNRIDAAITYLTNQSYDFEFKGFGWWQGECEYLAGVSQSTYESELSWLISTVFSDYQGTWPDLNFYFFHPIDQERFAYIRDAHSNVAAATADAYVAGTNSYTTGQGDSAHFTQTQYNAIGESAAQYIYDNSLY